MRVRRAREHTGMTQEDTAATARIDYKRYQRLEAGTVNATIRTLARVAEALDTDLWTMLSEVKLLVRQDDRRGRLQDSCTPSLTM